MKNIRILFIAASIAFVSCDNNSKQSISPAHKQGVTSKNAMVTSAHPLASKIGIDILKKGGNAFDAAIAVQFALAVCYPNAGNIGGGGFLVYYTSKGEYGSLDYREKAPSAAYESMYLDKDSNVIEKSSTHGCKASGVPGTVDGMWELHKKSGSLSWKELLQPAIDLAANGVVLTAKEAEGLNKVKDDFVTYNRFTPAYVNSTENWKQNDTLKLPELAQTLERIRDFGRDGFYTGKTAELIADEMKQGKGIISTDDLKNYKSVWRTPVKGSYKEYSVISMPPPSSGGIALIQLLQMSESINMSNNGFQSYYNIHYTTEFERRVYADRAKYLGDPDFINVPVSALLNKKYNASRIKNTDTVLPTPSSEITEGNLQSYESEETTHYNIVDKDGNAIAVTTTLNASYGSFTVVKGAGFILNNEMDDFSIKPGVPNAYGLVGDKANAVAPNKRMLSSMTPTIILKNNKLFMVIGTPGGSTIITSVFQGIMNVIEFGMSMQEAVDTPRIHHQWLPDCIYYEKNRSYNDSVFKKLTAMGYVLKERSTIGRMEGILVAEDGTLEGGADMRGDDFALGY